MAFYSGQIHPRISNAACGMKTNDALRERVCDGLAL